MKYNLSIIKIKLQSTIIADEKDYGEGQSNIEMPHFLKAIMLFDWNYIKLKQFNWFYEKITGVLVSILKVCRYNVNVKNDIVKSLLFNLNEIPEGFLKFSLNIQEYLFNSHDVYQTGRRLQTLKFDSYFIVCAYISLKF